VDRLLFKFCLLFLVSWNPLSASPLNDPTKPIHFSSGSKETKKVSTEYQLTGIFFKQGKYEAVINNSLYRKGDYVGNNKIVSIDSNSVVITGETGTKKLSLLTPLKKLKKK